MEVLPISSYQASKQTRDQKLYDEYKRLMEAGVKSRVAVECVKDDSEKICGTKIHAFETLYRIFRKFREQEEAAKRKKKHQTSKQ